jgi:Ca2+/H+ antiporter, TMEM165/GDT1 family
VAPLCQNTNDATSPPQQEESANNLQVGALAVFGSTFLTIFLSEMGDKTQLATLLMTAQSQSPWVVFVGASTALVATSLLGCLLGRWLANRISPQILNKAAGVSMLLIAAQLVWEIIS